jgi:predicted metal-binding protein
LPRMHLGSSGPNSAPTPEPGLESAPLVSAPRTQADGQPTSTGQMSTAHVASGARDVTRSARAEVVVCTTCRAPETRALPARAEQSAGHADSEPARDGERLLQALARAVQDGPSQRAGEALVVSGHRCLWSCQRGCSVHIRSPGRAGYVLCELSPTRDTAAALRAFAAMYVASDDGAVPYSQWPAELRGHFLCRVPAAGGDLDVRAESRSEVSE